MAHEGDSKTTCCPEFIPGPWDGKLLEWNNRRFIKGRVRTFFYMPLNFGGVMKRMDSRIRSAGGTIPDYLCLSDHTSKWNMDVYVAVDKAIPGAENTTVSGTFFSKVYEGPFKETARWCKDLEVEARSRKLEIRKQYMWYTTCPKCAKKYGKNYVAILAEVEKQ